MTYFGTNLKKIRQIKGLSQQAFAELIDLNRGVISSYEEGRAEPKIETLLRIANYFGISTHDIISKPLTVNQLTNFTLVEDNIPVLQNLNSETLYELNENGEKSTVGLQKIFAEFDCVIFVNENLANESDFEKGSILFLKEITDDLKKYDNYLTIDKEKYRISNHIKDNVVNYAVVGILGSEIKIEQKTLLQRIELLEKKVFGN